MAALRLRNVRKVRLINIVLVERGDCSFVTKVRIAQKKEARGAESEPFLMRGSCCDHRGLRGLVADLEGYPKHHRGR